MKKIIIIMGILFLGVPLTIAQEEIDDSDIADAIENEFRFDHAVNVNNVDVKVLDGIAELTGIVNNLKAKERATRIAEMVKGVQSVSNRIKVDPPVVLSDPGIRERVEQALLTDPAADSYEVDVAVEDKVVTLTGTVDSYQEKLLCANVAKSVKGVVDLKNDIQVNYKSTRSDWEIQNEIEQALKWNVLIDDGLIEVDVNDGEVELSGVVGSAAEKSNAYFASWVAGVRSVDNSGLEVEWWAEDEELRKNKYVDKPDEEIEQAIKDAALYDPRLFSFEITPEVENGWVTLRGTVDNLKSKMAAEKLAENTTGVTGVTNRIKVRVERAPGDEEIKSDIESSLANNAITEAWQIQVSVNHGIATLSGVVDSYLEKKEAEWVASGVQGVNDMNNILTVNFPYSHYWWGHYPYYSLYISPPESTSLVPDDELIKTKVANELWWSPYVDRDQIEITVNNGDVTLEGTVDRWKEYRKAAENAWEGGAWSVSNELIVR